MTWTAPLLRRSETKELTDDQKNVLSEYSRDGGRVCVDAGAGTGKTTTLIETLAEVILQESAGKPLGYNPLRRTLVVSFGKEASRQLKSKLKERLRDHEKAGGTVPTSLWRFIETQSDIETIDAFLQSMLREIIKEIGVNPSFKVPTAIEEDELVEGIIERIRKDSRLRVAWLRLETSFPSFAFTSTFGPEGLRDMLWNTHQKMREFCLGAQEVKNNLIAAVRDEVHGGREPPFTIEVLQQLAREISGGAFSLQCPFGVESQMVSYANDVYENSVQLAADFADLLIAFDEDYDRLTKEGGILSYIDIAYLVWLYTIRESPAEWRDSLLKRYDHILIDEFQDTNFVQYQVLGKLIRNGRERNRIMFIGDVKQSIYQWRSAEPQIFAELITSLTRKESGKAPDGMAYAPLTTNFRSNQELIDFFNGLFSDLFAQKSRGALAGEVPYTKLSSPQSLVEQNTGLKVHVVTNPAGTVETWVDSESENIAGVVRGLLSKSSRIQVRGKDGLRRPVTKDIALLFRRNRNVPRYVQALRRSGVKCAVQTDISLFAEQDTSLIIDFLDWLANPDSRESVTRILRSPLVALDDKTLRYLSSQSYRLIQALKNWNDQLDLPDNDRKRLQSLLRFRDDLRWDREARKASLINKIISFGHLDSVLLASEDGVQAQANLWTLSEIVAGWEEEELLGYKEFLALLKNLRDRARNGDERDYPRAILADEETDAVKVMTIHAAKGREFPIVIIPETIVFAEETSRNRRITASRGGGIIMRPRPSGRLVEPHVLIVKGGDPDGIPWVGRGSENALLWLSPERDQNGEFVAKSRINQSVRDGVAEFWRLLYVVMTRSKDHLVFSISTETRWNRNEWNSWMIFLRSTLGLDSVTNATNQSFDINLSGRLVRVGVNDLPMTVAPIPSPFAQIPTPSDSGIDYNSGAGKFLPSEINPSVFPILAECPRRYQYQVLWDDSGLREDKLKLAPPGAKPPRGMSANEWGTKVHESLRLRDFSSELQYDTKYSSFLDKVEAEARDDFVKAVKNFEGLAIGKLALGAASEGRELLKEQELSSIISINETSPPILVQGKFDLLLQDEDQKWILVDYKIEEIPPTGSFRDRLYRGQIHTYAWLISKALGFDVKQAFLAYIHPHAALQEVVPDLQWFVSEVNATLNELEMDPGKGLKAKPSHGPNGSCSACPYSIEVGGPCEN